MNGAYIFGSLRHTAELYSLSGGRRSDRRGDARNRTLNKNYLQFSKIINNCQKTTTVLQSLHAFIAVPYCFLVNCSAIQCLCLFVEGIFELIQISKGFYSPHLYCGGGIVEFPDGRQTKRERNINYRCRRISDRDAKMEFQFSLKIKNQMHIELFSIFNQCTVQWLDNGGKKKFHTQAIRFISRPTAPSD